jgi:hypothetical protein
VYDFSFSFFDTQVAGLNRPDVDWKTEIFLRLKTLLPSSLTPFNVDLVVMSDTETFIPETDSKVLVIPEQRYRQSERPLFIKHLTSDFNQESQYFELL